MGKITLTIGCSGSGKSTWAKEQIDKNPDTTIIVNRDKIREMLFGYTEETVYEYYKREDKNACEKIITQYQDLMINEALNNNKHVIIDATNLLQKHIDMYEYWNVPIDYVVFVLDKNTLIDRDSKRARKVGKEVIEKQYAQLKSLLADGIKIPKVKTIENNSDLPKCVVVDLDGTLAHKGDRDIFEWDKTDVDILDKKVYSLVNNIDNPNMNNLIICTGRSEEAVESTERWLLDNNVFYTEIHYRKKDDFRPDWMVKQEFWEDITKRYCIEYMIDDRNQVVRRARSLGFKVMQVEYGNF